MRITSSFQIGVMAISLSFMFGLLQTQADDREKGATNNAAADNAKNDLKAERVIGNKARFLSRTKIVAGDSNIQERVIQAKKKLEELRRITNDIGKGPQTIEEAAVHLSENINMACPPTKCFEHEGVFYFSGGTSSKPVHDFSSGLAIKKGEKTIYTWSALDKPDEIKSK